MKYYINDLYLLWHGASINSEKASQCAVNSNLGIKERDS